jgi:GH15 family glucan-1,4-alpha-glucosidase
VSRPGTRKERPTASSVRPAELERLARRSIEIITRNQAPSGAYLASPTFPVYRYSWFRDGAFIADAMSRAGEIASAEAFFSWCAGALEARRDQIEGLVVRRLAGAPIATNEFLHARYTVDGRETGEAWADFQLDGYGLWLWALDEHQRRHGRSIDRFLGGARLSIEYVAAFWDHPSYDWWEEFPEHRHTATLAALHAGLRAAATWPDLAPDLRRRAGDAAAELVGRVRADAGRLGRLSKWLGGDAVDASLIAVATPLAMFSPSDPLVAATVAAIEAQLVHNGGVHRYLADTYYGGGEWPLLAGFLGWHHAAVGRTGEAWAELAWIARQATPEGELPEQVDGCLLAPEHRSAWVARWGPVATPLLWSHAMYLTLAIELGVVGGAPRAAAPLVDDSSGAGASPAAWP